MHYTSIGGWVSSLQDGCWDRKTKTREHKRGHEPRHRYNKLIDKDNTLMERDYMETWWKQRRNRSVDKMIDGIRKNIQRVFTYCKHTPHHTHIHTHPLWPVQWLMSHTWLLCTVCPARAHCHSSPASLWQPPLWTPGWGCLRERNQEQLCLNREHSKTPRVANTSQLCCSIH